MRKTRDNDYIFEDYGEFVENLINDVSGNDKYITVIGKFDKIKDIIKEALNYEEVDFNYLQIHESIDKSKEFQILVYSVQDEVIINCAPAKNENDEYVDYVGNIVYVFHDCSACVLKHIDSDSEKRFVYYDDDCDLIKNDEIEKTKCDKPCECETTKKNCDDNGDSVSISKIRDGVYETTTYYTSKRLNNNKYSTLSELFSDFEKTIDDFFYEF